MLFVVIDNVHYNVSQAKLEEFLKDYEPKIVLIPSYVPRFSRYHRCQSWGIAFALFDSVETCREVISELNGANLEHRRINIRLYTPYDGPKGFFDRQHLVESESTTILSDVGGPESEADNQIVVARKFKNSKRGFHFPGDVKFRRRYGKKPEAGNRSEGCEKDTEQKQDDILEKVVESPGEDGDAICGAIQSESNPQLPHDDLSPLPEELSSPNSGCLPSSIPRKSDPTTAVDELAAVPVGGRLVGDKLALQTKYELSSDTIYIQHANYRITDEDVRSAFSEYNPTRVFIFKSNRHTPSSRSSHGRGGFRQTLRPSINVLVTVDVSQYGVQDIIYRMKHVRLRGSPMQMKVALLLRLRAIERLSSQQDENLTVDTSEKSVNDECTGSTEFADTKTSENSRCMLQTLGSSKNEDVTSTNSGNVPKVHSTTDQDEAVKSVTANLDSTTPKEQDCVVSGAINEAARCITPGTVNTVELMADYLSACKLDWASEAGDIIPSEEPVK